MMEKRARPFLNRLRAKRLRRRVTVGASVISEPDSRVDERVCHVHQEVDDEDCDSDHHRRPLYDGQVTIEHGNDQEVSQPGDAEDLFSDDGSSDQNADLEAQDRDDRDDRIPEGVLENDADARYTFGGSGTNVILIEGFKHRRSQIAREYGRRVEGECDGRQQHETQVSHRVLQERDVTARGEPPEGDAEQKYQQDSGKECRQADSGYGDNVDDPVQGTARLQGTDGAGQECEGQRQEDGRERQLKCDRQLLRKEGRDRRTVVARAEIQAQHIAEPAQVLNRHRSVEPEPLTELGYTLG